jgi:hypothetical protein
MRIECRRDPDSPYIMVWVRVECKDLSIRGNTEFAIDTGSPMSILSYEQGKRLGVPFHRLESAGEIRVGGSTADAYRLPSVDLYFRTAERDKLFAHPMEQVYVLGPSRSRTDLPVPGILGMDFLRDFTFILFSRELGGRIFLTDEDPRSWGESA